MDLVRLGGAVSLQLDGGALIDVRGSLLFDPEGKTWPRCSVLIKSFQRGGGTAKDAPKFARKWLGRDPLAGSVTLPPKALSEWKRVGACSKLLYTRSGQDSRGFDHAFGTAGGFFGWLVPITFKSNYPVLYARGGDHRLELGSGCSITPAGFVSP